MGAITSRLVDEVVTTFLNQETNRLRMIDEQHATIFAHLSNRLRATENQLAFAEDLVINTHDVLEEAQVTIDQHGRQISQLHLQLEVKDREIAELKEELDLWRLQGLDDDSSDNDDNHSFSESVIKSEVVEGEENLYAEEDLLFEDGELEGEVEEGEGEELEGGDMLGVAPEPLSHQGTPTSGLGFLPTSSHQDTTRKRTRANSDDDEAFAAMSPMSKRQFRDFRRSSPDTNANTMTFGMMLGGGGFPGL